MGETGAQAQGKVARQGVAVWLQLLHFGPSVFTALLFAVYIAIAAHGVPDLARLTLLLLAQLATQFSISLLNDVWDYRLDAITKPDKPLPSGAVTIALAMRLGWLLAAVALVLALALGPLTLLFNVLGLGAGLIYDYRLKGSAFSPLPFAAGFGVLPLWAWAGLGLPIPAQVFAAFPLIALLVLALHLADTLPDVEADRAAGLRGLAHRLGLAASVRLCWTALAGGIVLAALLGLVFAARPLLFWPVLGLATLLLLAAIVIFRREAATGLRRMAGLIELGSMLAALGFVAATNL